jgi:hypothetical protein
MAKNSSINSSIRQQSRAQDEGFSKLLEAQQASLGELSTIKELLQLSKDYQKLTAVEGGDGLVEQKKLLDTMHSMAKTSEQLMRVQAMQQKSQDELLKTTKEHAKGSRRYFKLQEDFEKDWRKESKAIAEMAEGMKTFKTMGEKFAEKKQGIKEKFGIADGGLKKTVLGAMNVGGIFNKTLEKDKFIAQQKALGAAPMEGESGRDFKKRLGADFEGANKAAKETKKTEAAIAKQKQIAGVDDEEYLRTVSPEFEKLLNKRQENADEFGKYQRATDIKSPTPVTRLDSAKGMEKFAGKPDEVMNPVTQPNNTAKVMKPMNEPKTAMAQPVNVFNKPVPTASPTETAAEATQDAETAEEGKKMEQEQTNFLKIIADNTGGDKQAKTKPAEEKKPEGGGFLDAIFSMLSKGLMMAFRALLNPGAILKALGRVFAIGMIIGALFEGIMDGFDEFSKSGDIGKALIAGLAGIIDFLTFGLFDKEKIKEVIGDFSKWTYDHLVKPFVDFISDVKDTFLGFIEKIGIPEIVLADNRVTGKIKIGPYYPFKKDAPEPSQASAPGAPVAPAPAVAAPPPPQPVPPQTANQVEQKSAENAGAKDKPATENKTNVVNAPVTTNNNNTTVQNRPPIRNQESSQQRYASAAYGK